jgi:hypothetical protein
MLKCVYSKRKVIIITKIWAKKLGSQVRHPGSIIFMWGIHCRTSLSENVKTTGII